MDQINIFDETGRLMPIYVDVLIIQSELHAREVVNKDDIC